MREVLTQWTLPLQSKEIFARPIPCAWAVRPAAPAPTRRPRLLTRVLGNCLSCSCVGSSASGDGGMSTSAPEAQPRGRAGSSSGRAADVRQEGLGLFECNICYDLGRALCKPCVFTASMPKPQTRVLAICQNAQQHVSLCLTLITIQRLSAAREPVITRCGHLYCWACFYK